MPNGAISRVKINPTEKKKRQKEVNNPGARTLKQIPTKRGTRVREKIAPTEDIL